MNNSNDKLNNTFINNRKDDNFTDKLNNNLNDGVMNNTDINFTDKLNNNLNDSVMNNTNINFTDKLNNNLNDSVMNNTNINFTDKLNNNLNDGVMNNTNINFMDDSVIDLNNKQKIVLDNNIHEHTQNNIQSFNKDELIEIKDTDLINKKNRLILDSQCTISDPLLDINNSKSFKINEYESIDSSSREQYTDDSLSIESISSSSSYNESMTHITDAEIVKNFYNGKYRITNNDATFPILSYKELIKESLKNGAINLSLYSYYNNIIIDFNTKSNNILGLNKKIDNINSLDLDTKGLNLDYNINSETHVRKIKSPHIKKNLPIPEKLKRFLDEKKLKIFSEIKPDYYKNVRKILKQIKLASFVNTDNSIMLDKTIFEIQNEYLDFPFIEISLFSEYLINNIQPTYTKFIKNTLESFNCKNNS